MSKYNSELLNRYIIINEQKQNVKFDDNLQNRNTIKNLMDIRQELDNLHYSIRDK